MSLLRRRLYRIGDLLLFLVVAGLRRPAALVRLHRLHHSLVIGVLQKRGLFDRDYYLLQNEDVANSVISPLRHYVQHGDLEGRWPMPLFDPAHYAERAGLGSARRGNRLLHYLCVGRYKGISPSPWFDIKYYLATNKDVARSGIDPLLHFVRWGGQEGRSPSPRFDSAFYLSANPEARDWGLNPLIHYLLQGQYEGRCPLPSSDGASFVLAPPKPIRPWNDDWDGLIPAVSPDAKVDVIVPVYAGTAVTLRCLHSVLRAQQATAYELVVINDASPESELIESIQELAGRGLFRLINNPENLGFVATANLGFSLHEERDVVLLNSDTEVYGDWLDRLLAVSQTEPRAGTVTPLSNNATICSYPHPLQDNPYPLEIGYDELDRLAAEANRRQAVEAPTGVGFCMLIARSCLREVGAFDVEAFGRGYGEENDFCQRAIKAGWKNLIACDVFVRHWGAASFQGERANRIKSAMEIMRKRHPTYIGEVKRFIRTDPLARKRARLDMARLARFRQQENVLIVTHARGGGTERHVMEDGARIRTAGKGVFVMRPQPDGRHVEVSHQDMGPLPNLGQMTLQECPYLIELLRHLAITELHIHHVIDFERDSVPALGELAKKLNVHLRIMVHDYTPICPRVNLVDGAGIYCGEPPQTECRACISRHGSDFGKVDISQWRARYADLYHSANAVVVPDEDVATRLQKYFHGVSLQVQPHESDIEFPPVEQPRLRASDDLLRIVVIGAISRVKGYDVLLACAKDARQRGLPIEFIVYGYTMNDALLRREGVVITGRYLDEYADEGLKELGPHVIWLPYVWPETYSYTLSIALRCRYPVFAFDLGAIASRLRAARADEYLMPLSIAWHPREINDRFVACHARLLAAATDGLGGVCIEADDNVLVDMSPVFQPVAALGGGDVIRRVQVAGSYRKFDRA